MIYCHDIKKNYSIFGHTLHWAVDELSIKKGERILISGPSGCGKTTLLNLLAGLLRPDEGTITIAGERIDSMSSHDVDIFRGHHLGLIFQSFQLLSTLTVTDNLLLGARYGRKWSASEAHHHADKLLTEVGLTKRVHAMPKLLSIGEQQRVAIARAVINEPAVILADEPTASLDKTNAATILDMLFRICDTHNSTLVMVSHDTSIASRFTRIIDASTWVTHEELYND
ncbi:MAG: ABC transporter ATP-binding protein [bacterium]